MITPADVLEAYERAAVSPTADVLHDTADLLSTAWRARRCGGHEGETPEDGRLYNAICDGFAGLDPRVAASLAVEVYRRLRISGRADSFHRALYLRLSNSLGIHPEGTPS